MTDTENISAAEGAWADARARYEQSAEPVAAIAAGLGLTPYKLVSEARSRGWRLRTAGQKKPSTRSALMRLRDTLQARISQFEQQIAELGKEADAVASEKEARAMNLLVRTLEKVLDLERKHITQHRKLRDSAKRLDDAARQELVRRIAGLRQPEVGKSIR